jgi:hypothetical protein
MSYNLRYTLDFNITQDDRQPLVFEDATLEIYEKDGTDAPETILGVENPIQINYQNTSEQILEPFIGSEATLNLIATEDFQLQDLYTEDELRWLVNIKRNGSVIWRGFIIPDGCQESFSFTPYTISVNAVDTLGLLKNLSYVQNDGNFWLGKQTFIEVIYNCLNRVQIPDMNIYTCVNIFEESYSDGDADDPLNLTYVNAETYLESDNINPLNCQTVLDSVLRLFTAVIIQSEGDWYIFRPNELALTDTLVFRKYIDGVYDNYVTKTVGQVLGGHTEGVILAPLYHTDTDQLKMIEKPFKNNSMAFKYGAVSSLITNPDFSGWNGITFSDWTKSSVFLPLFEDINGGAKLGNATVSPGPYMYIENITPAPITEGDMIVFKMSYYNYISDGPSARVMLTDGLTTWYLDQLGEWGTIETRINGLTLQYFEEVLSITARRAPITGDLTIRLYEAREDLIPPSIDLFITYKSVSIIPNIGADDAIGEIHTATQRGNYSFVKDTITVLNGDSATQLYVSSMYETDQTTLTSNWYRKYAGESILADPFATYKPLLRLAVEETERMHARPYIKFDGTIFGYFNPLSRFVINLLDGYFMPIKMNYDIQANKTQTTLRRIINEEIEQDYTLEPDYGETTKVYVK